MSYTNKTQPTKVSPEDFLKDRYKGKDELQSDALTLVVLYTKATGSPCVMWNRIFGFGTYTYKDSKGGEHEYLATGFVISSTGFTLYNMLGWDTYEKGLENLGKYKLSGKSCLAIKNIENIDLNVLVKVVKNISSDMKKKYGHK